MKFWDFIGEVLFFRWLFGGRDTDTGAYDSHRMDTFDYTHRRGGGYPYDETSRDFNPARDPWDDLFDRHDDYNLFDDDF